MPGITVGDGAIIAANSVVTKDIAPYTVVGGNPAQEIRKRFDAETMDFLLKLRWWDWDVKKITDHMEDIVHSNISNLKKVLY